MKLNQAVSLRLAELMQARAMTQYQLSTKSGVPKSSIGNIMHCAYDSVKLRVLHELCQGLSISLPEFFDSPRFFARRIWSHDGCRSRGKQEFILETCGCPSVFSFASPKEKTGKRKRARRDFDFPPDLLEATKKTPSVFLDLSRAR